MNKRVKSAGMLVTLMGVLLLGACGGQAKQEADAQRQEETGSSTGRETGVQEPGGASTAVNGSSGDNGAEEFVWKTREVEPPSFGEMWVHEEEIVEGVSVKIATPPIGYDFDDIEQAIRANSFITDHYKLRQYVGEVVSEAESYQEGDFHDYTLNQSVQGEFWDSGEEYYDKFMFRAATNYAKYDNVYSYYIRFEDLPWEDGLQENLCGLLTETLGEEYAGYLVYAETEGAKNHGLEEYIKLSGGVTYLLERKMKEKEGAWDLEFTLEVNYPGFMNTFKCYDGGMTPMLDSAKYDLGFFTEGNVSGWDLSHFSSDMPEYTAIDVGNAFIRNTMDLAAYSETLSDDGVVTYSLFSLEYKQGLADVPGFVCPSIDMEYTVSERDDQMISLAFRFSGKNIGRQFNDLNAAEMGEKVLPIMKEQINLMCPWLDLEEIGYDQLEGGKRLWVDIPVTCLGMECECIVDIEITAKSGKWAVNVKSSGF